MDKSNLRKLERSLTATMASVPLSQSSPAPDADADALIRGADTIRQLRTELEGVRTERDSLERSNLLLEAELKSLRESSSREIDKLSRVINRANSQRDFWMKAHAGLKSHLKSLGANILDVIKMSEIEQYGNKTNPVGGAPMAVPASSMNDDGAEVPRFLLSNNGR